MDLNRDGLLDILLVGEPTSALFLNKGAGQYEDVSARCGLARIRGAWKGCAIGDYDADGREDLLLTGYNCIALLHGSGDLEFTDTTRSARLKPNGWCSSAGFMDLDGDGYQDLFVGNYVVYNDKTPHYCNLGGGVLSGCPPQTYAPQYSHLYHNNRNGTFTDVTAASGLAGHMGGKCLVVAYADYDNDGRIDFYLGNDGMPADLFHNMGGMHFRNEALSEGVALGVYQQAQAAMGADWADYNRDGRLDLVAAKFSHEPVSLYRNQGPYFDNVSPIVGLADPTLLMLSFGTKFLDVDNDGWPDLLFANGSVYDTASRIDPQTSYLEPLQLFMNRRGHSFEEVTRTAGPPFQRMILGRGSATGDFDNDGRVDALVVDDDGGPLLLQNRTAGAGHWLEVELQGRPPDWLAYGARVMFRVGSDLWLQDLSPASSYLSSSSPWLHFGLGTTKRVPWVRVRWPNGKWETYPCGAVDRRIRLRQR
ncbi:MAG: CRTAC1 family protein [Chthonomonadales bacterium]